jgi:ABC-type Na+ transport system ATPase subunit NatA
MRCCGEVHAFLGPNGAGKTTTIRILLGLLRKDGGNVALLGGDPWREATRLHSRIADVTLWPSLTGGEIIDLLARLRGDSGDQKRRRELIEAFDLDPAKKARAYSKGNRQKVALIAALASDAELLLLDEPTAGLDPLMEAVFRERIEAERRDGRSVLLSSHILAEAEALADRVTIIRSGRTFSLNGQRDLGAGLLPGRPGRASASAALRGPLSLAWRLQWTTLAAWAAGYVFIFAVCGALVLAAVAVVAFGVMPSACAAAGWTALGLVTALSLFGPSLQLPHWIQDISPFAFAPRLPGGAISVPPMLWLPTLAAALAAIGLVAFRSRDMSLHTGGTRPAPTR